MKKKKVSSHTSREHVKTCSYIHAQILIKFLNQTYQSYKDTRYSTVSFLNTRLAERESLLTGYQNTFQ